VSDVLLLPLGVESQDGVEAAAVGDDGHGAGELSWFGACEPGDCDGLVAGESQAVSPTAGPASSSTGPSATSPPCAPWRSASRRWARTRARAAGACPVVRAAPPGGGLTDLPGPSRTRFSAWAASAAAGVGPLAPPEARDRRKWWRDDRSVVPPPLGVIKVRMIGRSGAKASDLSLWHHFW
jgi:hypothetical protein